MNLFAAVFAVGYTAQGADTVAPRRAETTGRLTVSRNSFTTWRKKKRVTLVAYQSAAMVTKNMTLDVSIDPHKDKRIVHVVASSSRAASWFLSLNCDLTQQTQYYWAD